MAGNKHHHVWQLLQRGFGEKRGKDHHIWVHQKGLPPKQTVTRKFGFEKHFYRSDDTNADDPITEFENDHQSMVQELRVAKNGEIVDPNFAAALISHLEMRSEFLRQEALDAMVSAADQVVSEVTNPKRIREMMVEYLRQHPEKLEALWDKVGLSEAQRPGFAELAEEYVKHVPMKELAGSMVPGLLSIKQVIEDMPKATKRAHNEVLEMPLGATERLAFHANRKYAVLRLTEEDLILPDTTLAFLFKGGISPFSQKDDQIEAVILPISASAAIVGSDTGKIEQSTKTINRILASCAHKAFLAKSNHPSCQSLSHRIGKHAKLVRD